MPGQQLRDDGICWTTKRCDLTRIRHACHRVQPDSFALTFVGKVKERLVAFDLTTECAAKVVVGKIGLRIGFGIEEVARVEFVVPEKLESRTVKIVRARLGD